MEFTQLLEIVGDEPVFGSALLLAGDVDAANVRRQLSRWTAAGWLYQLRRGVYALAPPYQRHKPHPFVIANALVRASYVSLQSALAYEGMIPEYTPVTTSVTTGRPGLWRTPLGDFAYRHIKTSWLHGYRRIEVAARQHAWVARPEKALLDLVYLQTAGDAPAYLAELRLQAMERVDWDQLERLAEASGSAKLARATERLATLAREQSEYEKL
jgi:predicted transcriptional regulator of viral defense system